MKDYENEIEYFVLEIRKIAASHQLGLSLNEAKKQVDEILQKMKGTMSDDKLDQAAKWQALLDVLKIYNRNTVDPRWAKIINHANYRIKSRLHTAMFYRKRFHESK